MHARVSRRFFLGRLLLSAAIHVLHVLGVCVCERRDGSRAKWTLFRHNFVYAQELTVIIGSGTIFDEIHAFHCRMGLQRRAASQTPADDWPGSNSK